ncbi:MAG: FlgO family outer membrane protein [Desulfovibrionaceae bacterium]
MKKILMLLSLFLLIQPSLVGGYVDKALPRYMPQKNMDDVLELRLKAKELVEQFMEDNITIFQNKTVLLTDIVDITNLKEESSLGKVFTEELYNEFVKRGISVREYRISNAIRTSESFGNSFLSERNNNVLMQDNEFVMVGTYNIANDTVTLNARILDPHSGLVQKTASIFFRKTPYITSLAKKKDLMLRTMKITNSSKNNAGQRSSPKIVFDRGIH